MIVTLNTLFTRLLGSRLLTASAVVILSACSGVDVIPDATDTFAATNYTRYAWRSEPPSQTSFRKDRLQQKSQSIRAGFEEKMSELGYRRVDKADAEFLVEYLVSTGINDGQLSRGGSNSELYPSSVNREIDGASADNAQALGGAVTTGRIMLVFVDAGTKDLLWRLQITMVVQDANRVDEDEVRGAVLRGLVSLPPAP
jgi:hypothetical protein